MKRVAVLVLAISLLITANAMAQRWKYGDDEVPTLYCVGIMGDVVPNIDGDLSEWAGYPAWNVLTFADDFIDNSFGTVKDLNSLDFTGKHAWHEGTNMLYYAYDVFDDVHVQESAKGQCLYWIQDDLEWYIDADNSGGSYNGNEPEGVRRCGPAQQEALMIGGVGDDVCTCSASKWYMEAPYLFYAGIVTETATGTQTTYEVARMLFDFLDETPDLSTIHTLVQDDVIGMSWDIDDQDVSGEGKSQTTAWYTTALTSLFREADNLNDVVMAPPEWDLSQVAVEAQTWGFIKATFAE
jgi:hypothetical protein